jgi:hypothetical protein
MRRGGFCSYGKTTEKLQKTDAGVLGLTPAGPALRAIARAGAEGAGKTADDLVMLAPEGHRTMNAAS